MKHVIVYGRESTVRSARTDRRAVVVVFITRSAAARTKKKSALLY